MGAFFKDSRILNVRIIWGVGEWEFGLCWELNTNQTALILRSSVKRLMVNHPAGGCWRDGPNSQETQKQGKLGRESTP